MRITFENGGYIEFQRSNKPYHISILIAAKSKDNPLKLLVNSAEIQISQVLDCIKSVSGPVINTEKEE